MSTFDDRIKEIIERNQQRPDSDPAKQDINFLLGWLASYKGKAEGYKGAIDLLAEWRSQGLI